MEQLRKIFNFLNLLIAISAIATLIWWHGFQYEPNHLHPHWWFLNACLTFYVVQFAFRANLSGNLKEYFRKNRLEFSLFVFLILEFLTSRLSDFSIIRLILSWVDNDYNDHLYVLLLHVWLLIIVGIELGKATTRSTIWKLSAPVLFVLSFVILIVIGGSLLMLPEMTVDKQGMSFIDALFTSISANCVTGLIVVDTATYFSFKGKVLILVLIQLGGLNIITFATYFMSFVMRNIDQYSQRTSIKELLHTDELNRTKTMLRVVVVSTLVIEFLGMIVLYLQWGSVFTAENDRIFHSIFHAVSAFNNAGFTLLTDGFLHESVQTVFPMHITIAVLVVLGGLGFTTLLDFVRFGKVSSFFKRQGNSLSVQSKIAVYSSISLIILGAGVFFAFEHGNSLGAQSFGQGVVTSFFQSITARTAGFGTVDFGHVSTSVIILTMLLMFIGASSGSTGGGIKTSTFTVLILAVWKRREKRADYGQSFLNQALVRKAGAIVIYSIVVITVGTLILILVEPDKSMMKLLFEEVSAFGTVGLSTGITPHLSPVGKSVIMVSMFIGRIGPLALAYSLFGPSRILETRSKQTVLIG